MDRASKVSEQIKKKVGHIIQNDLKDPRLPQFVSVLEVVTTRDIKHSKVYVSVMGSEEERKNAIQALKSAAGYIRRALGDVLSTRNIPEVHFELSDSIERGVYMTSLIDKVVNLDNINKVDDSNED